MDRSTDNHESAHFHSDRMYRVNGEWYFLTREGTNVGPFATKEIAAVSYTHLTLPTIYSV